MAKVFLSMSQDHAFLLDQSGGGYSKMAQSLFREYSGLFQIFRCSFIGAKQENIFGKEAQIRITLEKMPQASLVTTTEDHAPGVSNLT